MKSTGWESIPYLKWLIPVVFWVCVFFFFSQNLECFQPHKEGNPLGMKSKSLFHLSYIPYKHSLNVIVNKICLCGIQNYREMEMGWKRGFCCICWFTPHLAAMTKAGPGWSQEPYPGTTQGWQRPKHLDCRSLFFPGHEVETGSEVEHVDLKLLYIWYAGIIDKWLLSMSYHNVDPLNVILCSIFRASEFWLWPFKWGQVWHFLVVSYTCSEFLIWVILKFQI